MQWELKDPLLRFEKYLLSQKMLSSSEITSMKNKAKKIIEDAVKKFEKIKPEDKEEIFKYIYESLPEELQEREIPSGRKKISEFVFEGEFKF